jgi:hypothetical protein
MQQTKARMQKVIANSMQTPQITFANHCRSGAMRADEFFELLKSIRDRITRFESDSIFYELIRVEDKHQESVPREQRGLSKDKFLDIFGSYSGLDAGPSKVEINIVDILKPLGEVLLRKATNKMKDASSKSMNSTAVQGALEK